ncbi:hypothetical protein [Nostoc sp. 'Lobaria pulmonaria (5183) cyanobiont']|uniref:hypothetical protein n=1 Tax=Nostoc sp. 'Lobaria pulmonaria (5183) cyanobiont' TaxID=1618022 RepID=UPI001F1814B3|nr:hypothetical protein [Nostoc sp. 'Lobaria pulmonaria (5183) cyanobiont']
MLVSKHNDVVTVSEILSLEDFMANPPEGMEWVDEQLVEKTGMTLKHSEIQLNIGFTGEVTLTPINKVGKFILKYLVVHINRVVVLM